MPTLPFAFAPELFPPLASALAALAALLACTGIVRWQSTHTYLFQDSDLDGVQKFHTRPVPRVGGVGVALALALCLLAAWATGVLGPEGHAALLLLLAATPAFAAGLAEDLTKRVGVLARLGATMASAALAWWWLGADLQRLGLPWLDDWLLQWPLLSLALTLVAVAGVANAINIIDGFNGLMAGATSLMFAAFGFVAWQLGDALLLLVCLSMIGALLGFMLLNWPRGLIFMGDGGAYLVGFVLALVAVLLVVRHPQVSPWFCLLVCLYPVMETVFSMYRRRFVQGTDPGQPDALHLHTLIYQRLVLAAHAPGMPQQQHTHRRKAPPCPRLQRNSATAPYLWGLTLCAVLPAVLFWQYPAVLVLACGVFVAIYLGFYQMIVRFRSPRWMRRRVRARV